MSGLVEVNSHPDMPEEKRVRQIALFKEIASLLTERGIGSDDAVSLSVSILATTINKYRREERFVMIDYVCSALVKSIVASDMADQADASGGSAREIKR